MAARRSYQFGKYNHNIITAMVVAAASLTRGSAIAAVAVSFSRWLCRGRGSGQAMAARETHSVPRFCQRPAFLNEKKISVSVQSWTVVVAFRLLPVRLTPRPRKQQQQQQQQQQQLQQQHIVLPVAVPLDRCRCSRSGK